MTPEQTNQRTLAGPPKVPPTRPETGPPQAPSLRYIPKGTSLIRVYRIDAQVPHLVTASTTTTQFQRPI